MSPPRGSRWLPGVGDLPALHLFVLGVILAHTISHFAYMGLWRNLTAPDFDVNDFKAYYTAATAVRIGEADRYLYSDPELLNLGLLPQQPWVEFAVGHGIPHPSAYIYPPFLAVALAPLSALPYHAANLFWFSMNTALLAATILLLVRIVLKLDDPAAGPAGRAIVAATILFVSLNFFPTVRALQTGQVGFVLLFLITASLALLVSRHGWADPVAGICLALAAAIKLTPLILLIYLGWAGRRRAAAWGAGALAATAGLSIAVAGWANHLLYASAFLPQLSRGAATYANQSINGFLNRLFTESSMSVFDFSPEPASVRFLTRALAIALLGAAFVIGRRKSGPHRPEEPVQRRRLAQGYALVTLTTVLVAPISWEHQYVMALVPLAVMIGVAARAPAMRTIVLLSIAYCAMALEIYELVRTRLPRGSRPAMSYVLYGGLILWGLLAASLSRRERPA